MRISIVLSVAVVACTSSSWSPPLDRSLLVMTGSDGHLLTIRGDGTDLAVLPPSGGMPSWTPDGRIIFVSNEVDPPQIVIADEDGGNPQQIGNLQLAQGNPIAKPQLAAGLVVFSDVEGMPTETDDNPGPQNGTWLMHDDGTGLTELAPYCTAAFLSASGTFVTCTMERPGDTDREIWRIDTDGSGLMQLTFPDDADYPDGNASNISPDETTVALFSGKESEFGLAGYTQSTLTWGHRNVATIPATGGARTTITSCAPVTTQAQQDALPDDACIAADNPAWTPDGRALIYDRGSPHPDADGTWLIDLDGAHDQPLYSATRGAGNVPMKYLP